MKGAPLPDKPCEVCGRAMQWRSRWSKNWDEIKYCSQKCRREKSSKGQGLEQKIIDLLMTRSRESTICPSEVLPAEHKSDRDQMELVRQAARRLVHQNKIVILQKGQAVDPSEFRGPIRLKLVRSGG